MMAALFHVTGHVVFHVQTIAPIMEYNAEVNDD